MTESTVALRLGLCGLLLAGCATMPVVSDRLGNIPHVPADCTLQGLLGGVYDLGDCGRR